MIFLKHPNLHGALIKHFLEAIASLGLSKILTPKRRFVFVTLLIWVNVLINGLMEQFLQGILTITKTLCSHLDGNLPSKK